jgi:large subunit ribosomal protein L9
MEIILRDHVDHVGRRGEIVKVADGYARNYLLPRKLALPATEANRKRVERERKIAEAHEAEERAAAEAIAVRLTALELSIARRVGENDQLYGSVTNADIGDLLKQKGFEIDRRKILLPDPLKTLGETMVPVKLHRDVTAQLRVQVVKEE